MTFTVTYRGADGALREERVEAAGRAECFSQMKARGIVPLNVREGDFISRRGRRDRRDDGKKNGRAVAFAKAMEAEGRAEGKVWKRRATAAAAILILVAIVGGSVWWWRQSPRTVAIPKPEAPKKSGLAKVVKPAVVATTETNVPAPRVLKPTEEIYVDDRGVKRYKIGNGRVFDPDRPRRKINVGYDKDGNKRHKSRFAIFDSRVENEIAALIALKPGTQTFGVRRYDAKFEEEFRETLKRPIEILDSDTPREKAIKQGLIDVKNEIASRMAKGEKLADILTEARDELRREAAYRRQLQRQLRELGDSVDMSAQDFQDYVDAANIMLKERGAAPIHASNFIRNAIRIEKAGAMGAAADSAGNEQPKGEKQ